MPSASSRFISGVSATNMSGLPPGSKRCRQTPHRHEMCRLGFQPEPTATNLFKHIEESRKTIMSLTSLGLLAAFGAGILSFLAPCVLPLVPGYLSYLAGTSLEEAKSYPTARFRVSLHALCFVLGFVLVFTLLGAAAALVGFALRSYQEWLARLAGLLLILFGIALTG